MKDDELKDIWKSSAKNEQVKFEKSRFMLEIQSSIDIFNKQIKRRDARETIAAIIIIPVFIFYLFTIPYLLSKIASALIVVWAVYVIYRLQNTRQLQPSAYDEDYLTYLKKNKAYLKQQQGLLDGIFWWYIAPCLFCVLLFVLGFLAVPDKETWIFQTIGGGLILGIAIYALNKRSVKKDFEPRIAKIETLIETMEKTE